MGIAVEAAKEGMSALIGLAVSALSALIGWAISLEYRVRASKTAITEIRREQRERDRRIEADVRYIRQRLDRAIDGN